MELFGTEVWLPNNTDNHCDDQGEICNFFIGGYCVLLELVLSGVGAYHIKDAKCPAHDG